MSQTPQTGSGSQAEQVVTQMTKERDSLKGKRDAVVFRWSGFIITSISVFLYILLITWLEDKSVLRKWLFCEIR
jgi:hypothetical protein